MWAWSWILAGTSLTGFWIAGSGRRVGWLLALGSEILWLIYSLVSRQWGFLVSVMFFSFVFVRNWIRADKYQGRRKKHQRSSAYEGRREDLQGTAQEKTEP